MRALILKPADKSTTVQDIPNPVPGSKEILVRVHAVALNHVDLMNAVNPIAAQQSRVLGSDFAGRVVQVGEGLSHLDDPRAKVGARVSGFLQGGILHPWLVERDQSLILHETNYSLIACSVNDRPGAFAEYIAIDYDLTWNVPHALSLEEAASVSLNGVAAAHGVFQRLQLPCPFYETAGLTSLDAQAEEPISVFIYGASSSLGLYAAQFVKIAEKTCGKRIQLIGAARPSKHALLYEAPYSYDILVDHHDPQWPELVRKATGGQGVQYAIDAISQGSTVEQTDSVIKPGGQFAVFRYPAGGNYDIAKLTTKPMIGAVWEALGVEITYHGKSTRT